MCEQCDCYNESIEIYGVYQLKKIIAKIAFAVEMSELVYHSLESDRELVGQVSFIELCGEPFPDVMRYHFSCPHCGDSFMLSAETYHG